MRDIVIRRKYPKRELVALVENRMLGGCIQATNDVRKGWETLYCIEDLEYPDRIDVSSSEKYRFWRFLGKQARLMNIAEFQLFDEEGKSPLLGKVIGSEHVYGNDSTMSHAKAFDGDWLTFFLSFPKDVEQWVGLDLGKPYKVDKIRCVSRSDDNGIRYGDLYELVYWNNGEWKSLGQQEAAERFLSYKGVPDNSLLLLRNLTRGREERIFTYEEGKQRWW